MAKEASSTRVDSAFYPLWDGRMSISLRDRVTGLLAISW